MNLLLNCEKTALYLCPVESGNCCNKSEHFLVLVLILKGLDTITNDESVRNINLFPCVKSSELQHCLEVIEKEGQRRTTSQGKGGGQGRGQKICSDL